jgi:ankyrin repeat protein
LIEKYEADVNIRTLYNKTPFHFACRKGDDVLISYLLEKGASATVVDRDGCTPLHFLCESENIQIITALLPLFQGS